MLTFVNRNAALRTVQCTLPMNGRENRWRRFPRQSVKPSGMSNKSLCLPFLPSPPDANLSGKAGKKKGKFKWENDVISCFLRPPPPPHTVAYVQYFLLSINGPGFECPFPESRETVEDAAQTFAPPGCGVFRLGHPLLLLALLQLLLLLLPLQGPRDLGRRAHLRHSQGGLLLRIIRKKLRKEQFSRILYFFSPVP